MNTDKFPNHIPVSNLGMGYRPSYIFKILRLHTKCNEGENLTIAAYDGMRFHNDMWPKQSIGSDSGIRTYHAERSNYAIFPNLRSRVDHRQFIYLNQSIYP